MTLFRKKNCGSLSQHCKLKMKYKITSALKHIMLTINNINHTVHMTRTAHKELYSKSRIHSTETNNHLHITVSLVLV